MARWVPDTRNRLERAALELFFERGFDAVTVPDITAHVGLTTRTYFRHFADKREVLFADSEEMPALAARLVLDAPPDLGPVEVMAHGLPTLAASAFDGRLELLTLRRKIIDAHAGLRERELQKMEQLVEAIADAFRRRGVDDHTAAVVAETAIGVVKVSLRLWVASPHPEPLGMIMRESLTRLANAFGELPADSHDTAATR